MDFDALKEEFAARGFDDISATRQGQYINRAMTQLDAMRLWPYRETSVTGTPAPLLIPDLGEVEQVLDLSSNSYPLVRASWSELVSEYGDVSVSGTPVYWYVASPEGVKQIATFPESANTIGVQYWCVPPQLSADADEPLTPENYHLLIVDIAVRMAYRDTDNHQSAEALQAQIDRDVAGMIVDLMGDQGPAFIAADGVDC